MQLSQELEVREGVMSQFSLKGSSYLFIGACATDPAPH